MTKKKSNKKSRRSSKIIEEIYSGSPSIVAKIRYILIAPNVRLQLTLRNSTLSNSMQQELAKTLLGNGCRLPKNENQVEPQFERHLWNLKIRHGRLFKTRLNEYKIKHPEVDISSEDINTPLRIAQFLLYVVGAIAAALNVLDHTLNISGLLK